MNAFAGRLSLDFRADDPIYLQIVRQIEAMVREGVLKPGDQLPTVRELAIDLRINFSTVARAYRILDEQRLISTQRGRGTYIWDDAAAGSVQEAAAARITVERLNELARRFIQEAAASGASMAQLEAAFHQQLDGWKRDHPYQPGNHVGG